LEGSCPEALKAEKRHADTVQNAMLIGRIAMGDVDAAPNRAEEISN
jgi:hypothetical protein